VHQICLGQQLLPHLTGLGHAENAKLIEISAKEFARQKNPLASGGLKQFP